MFSVDAAFGEVMKVAEFLSQKTVYQRASAAMADIPFPPNNWIGFEHYSRMLSEVKFVSDWQSQILSNH